MVYINILSSSNENKFEPNIDYVQFPKTQYTIEYNSKRNIVWDIVVLYQDINAEFSVKCKENGLVYFSGEPPLMHPVSEKYLNQFDTIVCPHKKITHRNKIVSHGFLNWFYGYSFSNKSNLFSYEELVDLKVDKTKNISIITSDQKMMPGHNLRQHVIAKLLKDFLGQIDVYGKGVKFIDSKREGIEDYRFHICLENTSIDDYWTEKIADPLLGLSVPIYAGCTNIDKYFGGKGYFTFNIKDYNSIHTIVQKVLEDPIGLYEKMYPDLIHARTILMEKENIIPFLVNYIIPKIQNETFKTYTLKGLDLNPYSWAFIQIRVTRMLYRLYYKFKYND